MQVPDVVPLQSLPSEAEDLVDKLPTDREAAALPEVVRTKTFVLEPMSLEDALEQVTPLSGSPNSGWARLCAGRTAPLHGGVSHKASPFPCVDSGSYGE